MVTRIAYSIFKLAAWQSGMPIDSLSETTDLDSLARHPEDFWWFIYYVERKWDIVIPEQDELSLETLGDLISYVQEAIEKRRVARVKQPHNPVAV